MHFAKVSLVVLAIFSCVVADEEGNNGPRTGAVNSRRVPYANFRNEIPAVSHESAASNKFSNEATEISGNLNSGTGRNDIPQSYSFDYKATDEEGNLHYRQEQADASGTVRASYGYTDIEGLYRTVSYAAEFSRFHVFITTNEPGVDDKETPADVNLMVREPPVGIQEKYNEFIGNGVGLMMVYAGYSVALLATSLNSEFNSEKQFNSYSSRASNAARKPSGDSSYPGSSGGFGQSSHKGYDFDYKVADGRGNTHYHKAETDDKGTVRGTYGYKDIQGLYRVVDYMADASGFHAKIKTNEPGTDGRSPAYVEMIAEQPPAVFQGNYAEPVWIHQDKRIHGQSQYEQGTKAINKGDEPPMKYDVTRTMSAVVNKGFRPSSYDDEED